MNRSETMTKLTRRIRALRFAAAFALPLAAGCATSGTADDGTFHTGTGTAKIEFAETLTESRLAAQRLAEKRARDQILNEILPLTFGNGMTVEDAMTVDPFARARVYDTLRTAVVTDRRTDDATEELTVTVRLERALVQRVLTDGKFPPIKP